jgi:acetyl-CoA acetyltransferase
MSARSLAGRVAVVGVGYSDLPRRSERPVGMLAVDAVSAALDDAGLTAADVDGLVTYPETPVFGSPNIDGVDVVSVHFIARILGLTSTLRWHVQVDNLIPNGFIEAVNAVAAGAADTCVVFRTMHNPAGAYNAFTSDRAPGVQQFTAPFGLHRGYQYYGAAYARYLHQYGATREHMASLIVQNRENAARNPHAYFRDKPLTAQEYLDSRMLADPVCLLDCDLPVDGAAALVLTSAERAKDLRNPAALVAGYGQYVGGKVSPMSSQLSFGPPLRHIEQEARAVGDLLWRNTGLSPADVTTAQLYDGYSFFVYWWLEALGFCGTGEAYEFIQDGRVAIDGALPVNTFGGQLAEGRLHGIGHLAEAVLQAAGRAGERQVPRSGATLAAVGPLNNGSAVVAFTGAG